MNLTDIDNRTPTLVDQVENRLLDYISEHNLTTGSELPNEYELSVSLGVSRSVLREALSRLKMVGMIETRTRKGMILREPYIFDSMKRAANPCILGDEMMFDILEFRVALEIGISDKITSNITERDLQELDEIVRVGGILKNNEYALSSEYMFHSKLYQITGNKAVEQFQDLIHPIITFIKNRFDDLFLPINMQLRKEGKIVTHADLLGYLQRNDATGFTEALKNHFLVYEIFLNQKKNDKAAESAGVKAKRA